MKQENEIVKNIAEMLKNTPAEKWESPYMFPLFQNIKAKRPYRGVNQVLLSLMSMTRPEWTPYFITFNQAREKGGYVKKGEKSTMVEFWKPFTIKTNTETEEEEAEEKTTWIHRYYKVFNVCQCEGITAPEPHERAVKADESIIYNALKNMAENTGVKVINTDRSMAWYNPAADTINLPPLKYLQEKQALSVMIHEMVHSTKNRLKRELTYAQEECVAEIGALLGSAELHIPYLASNGIQYLRGWSEGVLALEKTVRMAMKALKFLGIGEQQPETETKTAEIKTPEIKKTEQKIEILELF